MKTVCFLLPDGRMKPSLLFLGIEIFETANQYLLDRGGKPYYEIKIAGFDFAGRLWNTRLQLKAQKTSAMARPDLIIVAGGSEKNDYTTKKNRKLTGWMAEKYREGTEIAGLCTGSFFLAATGLLNNKECTTHWKMANALTALYPDIEVRSDKIITESKGIYTASGAVSSMNLILYLIEKYNGRQAAVYCSKMMHLDIDRHSWSEFTVFEGQKQHDDEAIKKMQTFIEKNVGQRITVDFLAEKFSTPKRSLVRRFKKATHNLPMEYIQRTKIEAAKRKLETSRELVNEIMFDVGYTDAKAFRNIFKKLVGLTPIRYRQKYNAEFAK